MILADDLMTMLSVEHFLNDVPTKFLVEVFQSQNGRCALTGVFFASTWEESPTGQRPVVDKIYRSEPHGLENTVLVCEASKKLRGDMSWVSARNFVDTIKGVW
jgi:hypothetical protein